jgi:hypothetical protein
MTAVFSTYQSIQAINEAQANFGLPEFDLIICDEAHRTTGVTLTGEDESNFVRVHGRPRRASLAILSKRPRKPPTPSYVRWTIPSCSAKHYSRATFLGPCRTGS